VSDAAGWSNKLGLRIGANDMVVTGDFDKNNFNKVAETSNGSSIIVGSR